jgi:hypothetical protein
MKPNRRHLTQHRFQRTILWTLALLTWVAAILSGNRAVSTRHQRQRFDISLPWLADLVGKLLIIRAGRLARVRRTRPINYWRHGRDLHLSHLQRSALGARVRRKLKHKNIRIWIAQLITILRNLDTHAAPLAKRLRRGLTRLLRNWSPFALVHAVLGPPAPPPALSDSS